MGKAITDVEYLEEKDIEVQPWRPKTIAVTKKEKHEKEPSPPQAHKHINDIITIEIEEDKEYWLGVVNENL